MQHSAVHILMARSDAGLHDVNCTVRHSWRTIDRRRFYGIRIMALV